ncbi:MAG TPA: sigma-54 dependent transcriptional regulator [Spirochaetia bacterium]
MSFTVLIVDDEREMCVSLTEILATHGLDSIYTTDPRDVGRILRSRRIDLVVMDIRMPQMGGIDLLALVKDYDRALPVIMITGYPSLESAVQSMRYGALNFFVKPLKVKELVAEIERIRGSRQRGGAEAASTPIVTRNPSMLKVLDELERVAPTDAPVLVTGESGTGKELVASALHSRSARKNEPFVKINCASIPDSLLESEMFGHEKGAFTDAVRTHIGKLEQAGAGTIFFDEIGDMSPSTQPKLLRVLQDGEFQRIGGAEVLHTAARLVAATNRPVDELLAQKRFREDLFYRLSVVTIHLPPLRERKDDLDLLLGHFLDLFNRKYAKDIHDASDDVKEIFRRHDWPGNVREYRNCIERAAIFCEGPRIDVEHLPSQYTRMSSHDFPDGLDAVYEMMSRQKILEALSRSGGEKQKAARILNVSRKTLYNRMKKLGMQ